MAFRDRLVFDTLHCGFHDSKCRTSGRGLMERRPRATFAPSLEVGASFKTAQLQAKQPPRGYPAGLGEMLIVDGGDIKETRDCSALQPAVSERDFGSVGPV